MDDYTPLLVVILVPIAAGWLSVCLGELAIGWFAWRGSPLARTIGVLVGFAGAIVAAAAASSFRSDPGILMPLLVGFAMVHLFVALIFVLAWEVRPTEP